MEGTITVLMLMNGFGGAGPTSVSPVTKFNADNGQKYTLPVAKNTKLIGVKSSEKGIEWELGHRYKVLGIPKGNKLVAVRVKYLGESQK